MCATIVSWQTSVNFLAGFAVRKAPMRFCILLGSPWRRVSILGVMVAVVSRGVFPIKRPPTSGEDTSKDMRTRGWCVGHTPQSGQENMCRVRAAALAIIQDTLEVGEIRLATVFPAPLLTTEYSKKQAFLIASAPTGAG